MNRAQVMRLLTVASLLAVLLVELLVSWRERAPWVVWLLRWLPLLLFVPGMYADRLRSYFWLCLVCLLYFMTAVLRIFAAPGDLVAGFGLVAIITLFVSAMLYIRWRSRQLRGLNG